MLARSGPWTVGDFCSSFSKEDYTYFSEKNLVVRQGELDELVYQTCLMSRDLVFGVAERGNVFLSDRLRKEK